MEIRDIAEYNVVHLPESEQDLVTCQVHGHYQ